ncbi:MAG: polysaccharide biosynthesis tyrosine autokinase [Terracidiphilus sp.]|jgi:capsular exopolysaccharide synthesis family protein
MSDQPLLNDPGKTPVPHRNGAANLPARPSYMEVPSPVMMDDQGPGLLLEYWHMLRRRKGTLVLIACLGLLGAVLLTLPQTPIYQARTTIEIQNLNENFLNMRDLSQTANEGGANPLETDLQTQVNILQSESVLGQVIAKLDLGTKLAAEKDKGRLSAWRKALHLPEPKPASTVEDILPVVARNLKVRMQANTRLVEILYDSTDPLLAADIANTLTAEFIRLNLESRWQTTQRTGEWLTAQMEDVRIKLEKSEQQLQDYARSAGLLFTSEKDNVADEKLRQLQQELSRAQADRVTTQSKYELATTTSTDSLPEVLDDPTLKDYQVKLTDLRRQLAELSATLTPSHPSVKKIQAQVTSLEAARETERANVTRRIQNEFESAQRREKLLAASYDAQARVMTEQSAKVTHYDILKREVDNNRQLYDSMLQHVKEAGIASALHASNVRVVDPARPPARPYKPNLLLNSMLGLFAGGFLGIVFIVLRQRSDRSIQAPGEASLYLDVPELGVIPSANAERSRSFAYYRQARGAETRKTEKENLKSPVELVTWQKRPSALADSFRSTLASILYAGENGNRPRVIALTSAGPREGKTTVASNLALALAEIGRRVLLIDGDLRKPRLHEIFNVSNAWGLSDLLDGTKPPEGSETMVVGTSYRDLYVLPAGSVASSISNLLHSPRVAELLQRMRQEFDMVIIDTPPMLQLPDARVLGRLADAVILVVRSARTTKETAAAASQRLADDGTRVLGTVLNEWDPRKASNAGYDYGYRPYHYHEGRPGEG